MGFGSYLGGRVLCVLAVLLGIFGIAVMLGFFNFAEASLVIPLGVGLLVAALVLFVYGWYLIKSSKPEGTINVHNQ
jgi:protein-S-isoprenylcysteine O-methyltransferase Ste14